MTSAGREGYPFVGVSEIHAPSAEGAEALQEAFQKRLGLADELETFGGLEVWRDVRDAGRFLMVSWWESREAMVEYLRSQEHDVSHARIPDGDLKPRGVSFERFEIVAR